MRPEKGEGGVSYLKYTGLAFQIALTLFLFARIGLYFDRRSGNTKLIYTLILSCVGLIACMVYLIYKIARDN